MRVGFAMFLVAFFAVAGSAQTPTATAPPASPPVAPPVTPPAAPPATPPATNAGPSIPEGFQLPSEVGKGAAVTVQVQNVTSSDHLSVVLNDTKRDYAAGAVKLENNTITFTLPADAGAGRYTVRLTVNGKPLIVPGELRVASEQAAPVITALTTPVYPAKEDKYNFSILGDNFGNRNDTTVYVSKTNIRTTATSCDESAKSPCITVVSPHVIDVFGFVPGMYEGPTKVTVQVGSLSSAPHDLTFSHFTVRTVRILAFVVTALIALIVYWAVRRGVGRYRVGQEQYGVLSIFIIDKDTHSYSLSKLQLLLWTSASIFAYIYFFLCRILIQWKLVDFPDVPPGMATLIGLSAGTTVAAVGLTTARGPKGAGPQSPTPADFISSGGVVVAERFQFFVWTIVGVLGFIALVLASDPALLEKLPSIPDNFLALMGVSSAGYLAGKAVRRPGPVINRVDVSDSKPGQQLVIKVDGLNIEDSATVRIDGKDYHPTPDPAHKTPQDGGNSFYTHLEWTIKPWENGFDLPAHVLEILNNTDGQMATVSFALKDLAVTNIPALQTTKDELQLLLTITNAVGSIEAEWTPPGTTTATPVPNDKVAVLGDSVSVKLAPGETAGLGKLALIDVTGRRAIATVKVATPVATATPASVPVPAGQDATVTITGSDLPEKIKSARWKPPKGNDVPATVQASAAGGFQVTFNPGAEKGEGMLELVAGTGYVLAVKVTVI